MQSKMEAARTYTVIVLSLTTGLHVWTILPMWMLWKATDDPVVLNVFDLLMSSTLIFLVSTAAMILIIRTAEKPIEP